jgi:hypothetical protein
MKRIGIIGLCLMAVVAISAVAATTASAIPPELLLKLTSGNFPATFTLKGVGLATLKTANGNTITCQKTDDEGTFENAHLGKTTILFLECETTILGRKGPCGNEGSANMITLKEWVTHFGTTLKEAGVEASAVPGALILLPGGKFSFECTEVPIIGKVTINVTGEGVAGLILTTGGATPKLSPETYSALELVYEESTTTGNQKYTEFLLPLESNKLMSGLQLKSENSFEKKLENLAQVSTDVIEGFKSAAGGATNVEIVEG